MSPTDEDIWDDQQTAQFLKLSPLTLRKARMVGSNGPICSVFGAPMVR